MRLVEEEHQFRAVGIADLGQGFEKLGEQPEQEGRVKPWRRHQRPGGEDIDLPQTFGRDAQQIGEIQRRFAEDLRAALVFQHQQAALDRAHRGGGDIAIAQRQVAGILPQPDQKRLQILEIKQRQPLFVRDPEGDVQHALLRLGEIEQPGQQQRPHFGQGRAHRMPVAAKEIPEHRRSCGITQIRQPDFCAAGGKGRVQRALWRSGARQPGQIALHIRQEDRHPCGGKPFGEDLQRHRLAGAGGARDQPVPVGQPQKQMLRLGMIAATTAYKNAAPHGILPHRTQATIHP